MNSTNYTPTSLDRFLASYQYPILMSTFGAQVLHHQYIQRTVPAFDSVKTNFKASPPLPRLLRAGLAWAFVFTGLLTKITVSNQAVRDYKDPVLAAAAQKKMWRKQTEQRNQLD